MKKVLAVLLGAVMLLLPSGPVLAEESGAFLDEEFKNAALPAGWTGDAQFKDLSRALVIESGAGPASNALKKFENTDGNALYKETVIDMVFNLGKTAGTIRFIRLQETGGTPAAALFIEENKLCCSTDGYSSAGPVETDFVFAENTDYHMRLILHLANWNMDFGSKNYTFDVAVNGNVIAEGLPFVNPLSYIQQMVFYSAGYGSWNIKQLHCADTDGNTVDYDFQRLEALDSEIWDDPSGLKPSQHAADYALTIANGGAVQAVLPQTAEGDIDIALDFAFTGAGIQIRLDAVCWLMVDGEGRLSYIDQKGGWHQTDVQFLKGMTNRLRIYAEIDTGRTITYANDERAKTSAELLGTGGAIGTVSFVSLGEGEFSLDSISIRSAQAVSALDVKSMGLFDGDMGQVSPVFPAGDLTAAVTAQNQAADPLPVCLAAAVYSGSRITGVYTAAGTIQPGEEKTLSCNFTAGPADEDIALFLWDGVKTMRPYAAPVRMWSSSRLYAEILPDSIVSYGNTERIAAAMRRAQAGEPVTVAAIGGSITEGAGASAAGKRYADLVKDWWVKQFPRSEIQYINAGIGGTSSYLGAHRLAEQVLQYAPDFVVMDFACNDVGVDIHKYAYEQIIRSALQSEKQPGVMLISFMNAELVNTQAQQIEIGLHYDLPMVSELNALRDKVLAGRLEVSDILADTVHPNDFGHKLGALCITNMLDKIYAGVNQAPAEIPPVPAPLYQPETFKNGRILTAAKLEPAESSGQPEAFKIDYVPGWSSNFDAGWKINSQCDRLVFQVAGNHIGIVYKQSVEAWMARIRVTVDGGEPIYIDGYNPDTFGVIAAELPLASGLDNKEHTVVFEKAESVQGNQGDYFGLCALLASETP